MQIELLHMKSHYKLNIFNELWLNFFSVRVVDKWNDLPESIKSSTTVNNFKNNYDSHLALLV